MTQTPNLAIAHIAASQNQKEVTANEAFDLLDRALTDALDLDLTTASVTLTGAEFRRHIAFRCIGATPGRQLLVPQQKRLFVVVNTSTEHAIEVARGATFIEVGPGRTFVLYTDGTSNGLVGAGGVGALADLDDTDVAGAVTNDYLRYTGSFWVPSALELSGQSWAVPYRGARTRLNATKTGVSFPTIVAWDGTSRDSDGFWNAAEPVRLTVPAVVTKVRLSAFVMLTATSNAGAILLTFRKNRTGTDAFQIDGAAESHIRHSSIGFSRNSAAAFTDVLDVVPGDYFDLRVNISGLGTVNTILTDSWFALEVVEVVDAVSPHFLPSLAEGAEDAGKVMYVSADGDAYVLADDVFVKAAEGEERLLVGHDTWAPTTGLGSHKFQLHGAGTAIGLFRYADNANGSALGAVQVPRRRGRCGRGGPERRRDGQPLLRRRRRRDLQPRSRRLRLFGRTGWRREPGPGADHLPHQGRRLHRSQRAHADHERRQGRDQHHRTRRTASGGGQCRDYR